MLGKDIFQVHLRISPNLKSVMSCCISWLMLFMFPSYPFWLNSSLVLQVFADVFFLIIFLLQEEVSFYNDQAQSTYIHSSPTYTITTGNTTRGNHRSDCILYWNCRRRRVPTTINQHINQIKPNLITATNFKALGRQRRGEGEALLLTPKLIDPGEYSNACGVGLQAISVCSAPLWPI